jgi:hypothetical protein
MYSINLSDPELKRNINSIVAAFAVAIMTSREKTEEEAPPEEPALPEAEPGVSPEQEADISSEIGSV